MDDKSIFDQLGERNIGEDPRPRSPLWSRTAYDRYLEWAIETGTTPNGVFAAKLMWGYFGDFVSLLRNIPRYRDLPLAQLLPEVFPDLTFVRVVRANKIRQAVSLWKAVQTATWRENEARRESSWTTSTRTTRRRLTGASSRTIALSCDSITARSRTCSNRSSSRRHPGTRSSSIAACGRCCVLYENFAADPQTSTLSILDRLGLEAPADLDVQPRMRRQSDGINDDWVRRFSELRLGTEFDLVPAIPRAVPEALEPRPI